MSFIQIFGVDLEVAREESDLALLLLTRKMGGMSSLFFIALTTPMIEIFSVLKSMCMPDVLVELSMLIYRYIFVLLDQAAMINNAQTRRLGNSGTRASQNTFSMLCSFLFLKAWELAERLAVAMDSRCYDGRLEAVEQELPILPKRLLVSALYLGAMVAISFLTSEARLP